MLGVDFTLDRSFHFSFSTSFNVTRDILTFLREFQTIFYSKIWGFHDISYYCIVLGQPLRENQNNAKRSTEEQDWVLFATSLILTLIHESGTR